jgi:hypothetical protein
MKQIQVPLAIVACLGKSVTLRRKFQGAVRVYPAGHRGVLTSIQCDDAQGLRLTVALEDSDPSYWETVDMDDVQAESGQVSFTLDLEGGRLISPPLPR